jgi:hypothetical protein
MRRGIAPTLALTAALALAAGTAPRACAGDGLPDARMGIRTTPLLLLTRADVRAELRLSPEQAADAERTVDDLREKAQALKGRVDNEEVVSLRAQIDASGRSWIEGKLTPAQRERLVQLELQWEGPAAVITRSYLAESLALTDSQRRALSKVVADHRGRRGNGPPVDADEATLSRLVHEQLTEAQESRWKTLIGPIAPFRPGAAPAPAGAARP